MHVSALPTILDDASSADSVIIRHAIGRSHCNRDSVRTLPHGRGAPDDPIRVYPAFWTVAFE